MEKEAVLELGPNEIVDAGTAAVVSGKLLQIANGAVYDENGKTHIIHESKLDTLEDVIEAVNGRSVLVFYAYQHDLERIMQRFPQARKLEGSAEIDAWNRERFQFCWRTLPEPVMVLTCKRAVITSYGSA